VLPAHYSKFAAAQQIPSDAAFLLSVLKDGRIRLSAFIPRQVEILDFGECALPVNKNDGDIIDISLSADGWLSVLFASGSWYSHALSFSPSPPTSGQKLQISSPAAAIHLSPSAVSSLGSEISSGATSISALNTSHVLLAAVSRQSKIQLLIWDLQYGVVVASHAMSLPSALADDPSVTIKLVEATDSQALVLLSGEVRCIVLVAPFTVPAQSTISAAMGRAKASEAYLTLASSFDVESNVMSSTNKDLLRTLGSAADSKTFETAFFNWVRAEKDSPAVQGDLREVPLLGTTFVKAVLDLMFSSGPGQKTKTPRIYSPKAVQYLLERRVVSSTMIDGHLLQALQSKKDLVKTEIYLLC
jgi:hypothetical protein